MLYLPNVHRQWPLHQARLQSLDDGLVTAARLPAPDGAAPVSVLYSPAVAVRFGPPMVASRHGVTSDWLI